MTKLEPQVSVYLQTLSGSNSMLLSPYIPFFYLIIRISRPPLIGSTFSEGKAVSQGEAFVINHSRTKERKRPTA